jgi:hypothetical protein
LIDIQNSHESGLIDYCELQNVEAEKQEVETHQVVNSNNSNMNNNNNNNNNSILGKLCPKSFIKQESLFLSKKFQIIQIKMTKRKSLNFVFLMVVITFHQK